MSTASNIINFEYIKVGTSGYSGNADTPNIAFRKINSNFTAIANSLTNIIIPVASTANTGTVKIGDGINIAPDGTISVGQTVHISAPGNLTGAFGDTAGVLESDMNVLYVSTGSFSPSYGITPTVDASNTNILVTTSSYIAAAAQAAAQNYVSGTWVVYDTNYRAYPVTSLTFQALTLPVTTLTLSDTVNYTSSTAFYVATQDVWHRLPYINHAGKLPVSVIPYQVGNITYSYSTASQGITIIGTTAGDLTLHPNGSNTIVNSNLIINGALNLGAPLTVSTTTAAADYTVSPIGNIILGRPTHVTSGTTIDGVLTASASLVHYIGGISLGPMEGASGEAISTNAIQRDLYVLPYGDLYIGNAGKAVLTHMYGNADVTGSLSVTADLNVDNNIGAPVFRIPAPNSPAYHVLQNINTQDLNIQSHRNAFLTVTTFLNVSGQVQATDFTGAGTNAYLSRGADVRNGLGIDQKLTLANSTITASNGNDLTITGGANTTDSVTIKTNSSFGTVTLTASNASAVLGQGIVLKGNSNSSEVDITDSVYVKSGSSTWKFDQYGRIIFPNGTIQLTAFTANPTLQGLTVTNVALINQLSVQTTATVNGSLTVAGAAQIGTDLNVLGNAIITGNFTVLGASTIVNSTSTAIQDPVIDIGGGQGGTALVANDGLDKGLVLHYFDTANNRMFAGRDATTGRFIIRDNIDPGTGPIINSDYTTQGRWADVSVGSLKLLGGTAASSNTTGDLQVAGGASVQGDLYVGGTLNLSGGEIVVGGVSFQNGMTLSGNVNPASEYFTITNGAPSPVVTFQVDTATGNTDIFGTINVRGAGIITGLASLQNNLNLAGDLNIAVNKFTVASVTGNTAIAGTLNVNGATTIQNSLGVSGTFAINTNKFLVTGSSGNTSIAGTLGVAQNFSVATNKFTVTSSTGNTSIAGTLDVGSTFSVASGSQLNSTLRVVGATTLDSTLGVTGNVTVGTNALTVESATGNLVTLGTADVYGTALLRSSLTVSGASYLNSTAAVAGDFTVNTNKFKVVSTTGNTTVAGTLAVGGNTALSGTLAVTDDLTVGSTNFVVDAQTGNVASAGTLSVTGASTLSSTLHVVGAATFDSTIGVGREVTLNTTTQATTLGSGALVVQGGASIAKNLFVGGDLGVTGNISGVQGNFSGNVTDNNQRVLVNVVPSGSIGINVSNLTKVGSTVTWTINNLGVISVANGTDTVVSATTGTGVQINNVSTLQTVTGRGATTNNALSLTTATDSTTTGTGALVVTGGVGIGKNLYVGGTLNIAGGTTITGNIAGANITDNGQRVLVNVVPTAGAGINISSLTKTNSTVSFIINNLGVNTIAGTTNNITVSQSTGSVTVNLGTVGTAGTYTYASSFTTDQFGRVLSVTANTATGTGPVVLSNSPIINSPTINNSIIASGYTGYLYGNGSNTVTASPYIPGAIVTGTVPAAYTATMLTATLTFSATGDVSSPTANFNGTQNVVLNTTLATVTQGAGSGFVKIAIDTKGRVVGNSNVTDVDVVNVIASTPVLNASNLLVQEVTTSSLQYPSFVSATSGYKSHGINQGYTFNPGTGALTVPTVVITTTTNSTSTNTGALTVAGGLGVGSNAWIGGNLNVGGGMFITGDLYVDGTQTYINSTNVQTGDKVFYLSTSSANAALAVNAGIAIGPTAGTFASLLFDGGTTWKSKANINPDGTFGLGTSVTPWNTVYGTAVYDNSNRVMTNITAGTGTQIISTGNTTRQVNIIPATNSVIGGVKGSSTINVASDGSISTISSQTNITAVGTLTSLTVQSTNASPNFTARIAGQGSGDKLGIVTSGTAGAGIQYQSLNAAETAYAPFNMSGSTIALGTNGAGATPTMILNNDGTVAFTSTVYVDGLSISGTDIKAATLTDLYIDSGTDNGSGGAGDSIYVRVLNAAGIIYLSSNGANVHIDPTTVTLGSQNSSMTVENYEIDLRPFGVTNPYRFTQTSMYFPDGTQQTSAAVIAGTTATNSVLGYVKLGNNITPAGDGTISVSTATTARDGVVKIGAGIYAAADGTISVPAGAGGVISIAGTDNQIIASSSTGTITLSLPQNITSTATVTFGTVTSTGAITDTGNRVITSVTPTAGGAINISSLTSSGPAASFTINNLGVHSVSAGTRVAVSQATGTVTISVPDVGVTAVNGSTGSVLVVNSITAGTAMNVNNTTGTVTINNLGVTSLTGSTYLNVDRSTGTVTLTNIGVTNILPGTGITVDKNTGTVTITNAGVTAFNGVTGSILGVNSVAAGTNVAVSATTGSVTISVPNIGVTAVNGSTGSVLVVSSITAGTAMNVSATTGTVTVNNLGVTSAVAGTGITVSAATGTVTFTNAGVTAFNGSTGAILGVGSITGTANQVTASASTGSVTLSLPQSIATSSTPQFAGLTIAGTGAVTIGSTTAGTMNNVAIGATTATTAKFTGLTVGYVSVGSATYTADANTNIIGCNRAGTIGVTLPAVAVGRMVTIKDESGNAASNVITITPASGLIEGNASYTLNINYGSITTYCNGTNWFII